MTDSLDDAFHALDEGKNVLLVKLAGPAPGVTLGCWAMGGQRGTAIARHPAFGSFPHDGFLNPLVFRMVRNAVPLSDGSLRAPSR